MFRQTLAIFKPLRAKKIKFYVSPLAWRWPTSCR